MVIPDKFFQLWLPLIQRICESNILEPFVKLLLNATIDEGNDSIVKEIAAIWLNTIFKRLHNTVNKFNSIILLDYKTST